MQCDECSGGITPENEIMGLTIRDFKTLTNDYIFCCIKCLFKFMGRYNEKTI